MFFYDGNCLHIGNYKSVSYVENNKIIIILDKKKINIIGEVLKIISLNDSEMYIQGFIKIIELVEING